MRDLALGNYGALDPHAYFIHGSPATWNAASPTLMTGISQGSQFAGETCPSSTYCVAVGQDGHTGEPLALVGDPSTWATAHGKVIALGSTFHSGGRLESVACSSTTSCVAVGYDNSLEPFVLRGTRPRGPARTRCASSSPRSFTYTERSFRSPARRRPPVSLLASTGSSRSHLSSSATPCPGSHLLRSRSR